MNNYFFHIFNITARVLLSIAFMGMIFSCQEMRSNKKNDSSSSIKHDQIDTFFGNTISKILFGHLYVVVDSVTYTNIVNDKHWKSTYGSLDIGLPDFEPIHTTTTSTCYLRGDEHYIEILGPNNDYNEPVGKSGIGFLLRNRQEHFHLGVKPKLLEENNSYLQASQVVDMPINNKNKTWFKTRYTPSSGTALHKWYAFYNPPFLDEMDHTTNGVYSRETFLESSYSKKQLFNGINRITMQCTNVDFERIVQELRYLGSELIEREGNYLLIASGDIELKISTSTAIPYSHITQIDCGLNTPDQSTTRLDNLVITNKGTESIWTFDNLYTKNKPNKINHENF